MLSDYRRIFLQKIRKCGLQNTELKHRRVVKGPSRMLVKGGAGVTAVPQTERAGSPHWDTGTQATRMPASSPSCPLLLHGLFRMCSTNTRWKLRQRKT